MKLQCETNTRAVENRIRRHFAAWSGIPARDFQTDFEHGQWWVTALRTGKQWSVCDSEPGPFCYEQVSQGDED
jgi:hypothetical protein